MCPKSYISRGKGEEEEGEEEEEEEVEGEEEEEEEGLSLLTWKMCSVKKGVKGAIIRVIRYTTENRACRDWRHSSRPCSPCDRVKVVRGEGRGKEGVDAVCSVEVSLLPRPRGRREDAAWERGYVEVCMCVWPTLMRFLLNRTYQLVSWSMNLTSRGTTV